MERMLALRDSLSRFYGRHDTLTRLIFKFVLALWMFMEIRIDMGNGALFYNFFVICILSLVCAFLPSGGMIILGAAVMILCLYGVSLEAVIVGGGIILIVLMLYFSIAPSSAYPFVVTALFVKMGLGCVPAVLFGLIGSPLSAVGIAFGGTVYSFMQAIIRADSSFEAASAEATEAMVQKIAGLIEEVITTPEILFTAGILAIVMLVVYFIRRLAVKYAWTVAAAVGSIVYILLRFAAGIVWGAEFTLTLLLTEIILALLVAIAAQLMLFSLDYKKTETVRFEDDEYYYFVRAVPKKKIHRKKRRRRSGGR